MSDQFEVQAQVREDMGKGSSRRLRRLADQVPAIIYGGKKDPQPLTALWAQELYNAASGCPHGPCASGWQVGYVYARRRGAQVCP